MFRAYLMNSRWSGFVHLFMNCVPSLTKSRGISRSSFACSDMVDGICDCECKSKGSVEGFERLQVVYCKLWPDLRNQGRKKTGGCPAGLRAPGSATFVCLSVSRLPLFSPQPLASPRCSDLQRLFPSHFVSVVYGMHSPHTSIPATGP